MEFAELKHRVSAWHRVGLDHETIARNLRIHPAEVREIAQAKPQWEPTADEIAAATAAIRAQWSEADWAAACRLHR